MILISNSITTLKSLKYFGQTVLLLLFVAISRHAFAQIWQYAGRICRTVDSRMEQIAFTVQMAEWYGASASGSVDLGFDSKSGQTNDFENGIHSFPA